MAQEASAGRGGTEALRGRIEELENILGLPQKQALARAGAASAEARARALQLPDVPKSQALASTIATLAARNDVVVEWTAKEIQTAGAAGAAASCACCCCCCCVSAAQA